MQLTKCGNGHYYDNQKFLACPHCANAQAGIPQNDLLGENQDTISSEVPTEKSLDQYQQQLRRNTVGWLVCIEGEMFGESFILREGDNHIGRSTNMDVSLRYEVTVSRKNHAILSYESKDNRYILHVLEQENEVYCNNKLVKSKKSLKNRDIIILGQCALLFIPLCNNSFDWETIKSYPEWKKK